MDALISPCSLQTDKKKPTENKYFLIEHFS